MSKILCEKTEDKNNHKIIGILPDDFKVVESSNRIYVINSITLSDFFKTTAIHEYDKSKYYIIYESEIE